MKLKSGRQKKRLSISSDIISQSGETMTEIKKLTKTVKELDLDIKAISDEHDRYCLKGSSEEIMNWFKSLPIETLRESIDREHKKPRTKYSLRDMKHKFELRKLHDKKTEELYLKKIELNIAKIDLLLSKIEMENNE